MRCTNGATMTQAETTSNGPLEDKLRINLSSSDDASEEAADVPELSEDDVFHLLQNERRRRVLAYLREHDDGEGVDMRDVVDAIAAEEHDTTVQALRSKERQRVYIALYQSHLPKLDDAGVIEYDQRRGWVSRTAATENVERYLETDTASSDADTDEDAVPSETAATGVAAVLLVAGYSGYVPVLTDAIVSIGLFALLCVMVARRRLD